MIGMARGLMTTFSHLVRPAITERYPYVKPTLPERSRSAFALRTDDDGALACKVCLVCERDCPDGAITIVSEKPAEGGRRSLVSFTINLGTCMYCGLCVESCPSDAIVHTGDFEQASTTREGTLLRLYECDSVPSAPEAGEAT